MKIWIIQFVSLAMSVALADADAQAPPLPNAIKTYTAGGAGVP